MSYENFNIYHFLFYNKSCLCQCAVKVAVQELIKSFRKESPSAATTAKHVQRDQSATAQVYVPQTLDMEICICFFLFTLCVYC